MWKSSSQKNICTNGTPPKSIWRIEELKSISEEFAKVVNFWRFIDTLHSLTSTNMVRIIYSFRGSYFLIILVMGYFFHLLCHTKQQIFLSIFKWHLPHEDEVKAKIRWNFSVYFCIHLKKSSFGVAICESGQTCINSA